MKKASIIFLILFAVVFISFLFSNQVDPKVDLLKAKYLAYLAQQRSKRELAIFEALKEKEGFMRRATDYLNFSESYKKIHEKRQKVMEKLNQLRAKGDLNSIEYYKTLEESYNLLALENKQIIAEMEKGFYDSYMYTIEEFAKGSWSDIKFIANELWGNIGEIISPLLEGDFAGFVKNVILGAIDATFKLRFIDFYKDKATEEIAAYWWDYYIVSNLKKTETQKLVEDIVNKGKDELKDKLEKSMVEGVKSKLIESGKEMTKDEIKKEAEKVGKNLIKNLIEFPALLVELVEKYYSVYTFIDLFQQVAPNEFNYIEQIKAVLKELNMLDEDQINNCYRDKVYFMNLRKKLKKISPPKAPPKENVDPKYKVNIKPAVKSKTDVEVKIAQEFVNEVDKLQNHDLYINRFDVSLFTRLVDLLEQTLRENSIDYNQFLTYSQEISSKFNTALSGWYKTSLDKIEETVKNYSEKEEKKSELKKNYDGYKKEFESYLSNTKGRLQSEMEAYQQKIVQMLNSFDITNELNSLNKGVSQRCLSFINELNERYKFVRNAPSSFYGDIPLSYGNSSELIEFLKFTGVSEDILNPQGSLFLKVSKFFITELYYIWENDYESTSKLLSNINDQKNMVDALLSRNDWRIYYQGENGYELYDPIKNALNSFYKRSKLNELSQRFNAISSKKGFVEGLIKKYERGLIESRKKIFIFEGIVKGEVKALNDLSKELEGLMKEVENGYVDAWKDLMIQVAQTLADMYYEKVTPELAREKIEKLGNETPVREMIYKKLTIEKLLQEVATLSRELIETKNSGFFNLKASLKGYRDKFGDPTISPEEVDFDQLKKDIETTTENWEKLNNQKEVLERSITNSLTQNPWFFTQFVKAPDNNYTKIFSKGNWIDSTYSIDENWNITLNIIYYSKAAIDGYLEEEKALQKANEWYERRLNELESEVLEFLKNPTNSEEKNRLLNELDSMYTKFKEIYTTNYKRPVSYHPTLVKEELDKKWQELRNKIFNAKAPIKIEISTPKINLKSIKKLKPKRTTRIYFDQELGYPFSIEFSLDNSNLVVGIQNDWYLLNIKRKKYTNLNAQVLIKPFAESVGPYVMMRLPMIYQLENNKYLAFNEESGTVGIWVPGNEPEIFIDESFPMGKEYLSISSISSDRRYLLIKKSIDSSIAEIYVYDLKTGSVLGKVVSSFSGVSSWIPGETNFVYLEPFTTKIMRIYAMDGTMIKELELPKDKEYFNTIASLSGGKYVLLISERDGVVALDTETGKLSKLKLKLGKDEFPETVFSSATGSYFGVVFGKHSGSGYRKGIEIYILK